MKKLSLTLSGLLLATTALGLPVAALAQDAAPAAQDEVTEVEEIVVRGRNIPEPMRETSEVAAFVSVEDLARQGDDTAATALTRVTGLSVVNSKFVYVRGLGERYSSALLNGSPLPSPEPLQRVVPLDLFPSSVLGGISVQKTYSPEFPGEFGGGVIQLSTVAVPRDPFVTLGFSLGYNSETTWEDALTYYGGDTDNLGVDDGTRKLPNPVRDGILTGLRIGEANFDSATLQVMGRSFENASINLIQEENAPLNGGVDFSAGRSFDLGFGDFGFVTVLGYDNSWTTRDQVQQLGIATPTGLEVQEDFETFTTQQDVLWNALLGFGLEMGDHEFKWTNLYVRATSKEARISEGESTVSSGPVRDDNTAWYQRELIDTQLTGQHRFEHLTFDWRGAYARTERDAPYERSIRYRRSGSLYTHNPQSDLNLIRFSEVEDTATSFGADVTWAVPPGLLFNDLTIKAGYAWYLNDRYSDSRAFRFTMNQTPDLTFQTRRIDYIYSDFNIGPLGLILREVTGSEGAAAYEAELETQAGYVQAEAEILPAVRASVGVRFEDGEQSVRAIDLFSATQAAPQVQAEQYFLPAATLTWNFAEDRQLRFGASKTIARPQFREQAPQIYFDPESDRLFIGNPYLVDSEILNLDARFEWYFERGQYFTLGAFYKDIDKPIEAVVNEGGAGLQQSFLNAPKAVLIGAEIEGKKYFDLTTGLPWVDDQRWLIMANYTYSKAEVQAEAGDVVFPRTTLGAPAPATDFVIDGSRLQGQSEHLANLQFGFENDAARSQATLLVTYASERTTARGPSGQPDIVQEPGTMLDFVYRKGFDVMGRELTFSLEARNLLAEDFDEFQSKGSDTIVINRYDLGSSVSLGLSARF